MDLIEALYAGHPHGFSRSYAIELLADDGSLPSGSALESRLRARCPEVTISGTSSGDDLVLALRQPLAGLSPSWTVGRRKQPLDARVLAMAVEQSWWWPDGQNLLPRCDRSLMIRDHDVAALDPPHRLELLQRILVAVLEVHPCLVLHWIPTQQLVDPIELVKTCLEEDFSSPLPGGFNVRFYRIESDPGDRSTADGESADADFLMDTLGLTALGRHDLQCHFRGLDPDQVSPALYRLALYLWQQGPVIEDGHTVAGLRPEDHWRCQHELAIASPERDVIDLDPGFPFAAGFDNESQE